MADTIRISYSGLIRNALGVHEEDVPVADGMVVRDLLKELWQRHGNAFARSVLNRNGGLRANAQMLLGGRDIREIDGLDTKLGGHADAYISVIVHATEGG